MLSVMVLLTSVCILREKGALKITDTTYTADLLETEKH